MITEIHAIRMDGLRVDAEASVRIQHQDDVDVLEAVDTCLSEWFSTTDEGRHAWEYSSHDFNIGDLLCGMMPPEELQSKHGIHILHDMVDRSITINYDRVLGNVAEEE